MKETQDLLVKGGLPWLSREGKVIFCFFSNTNGVGCAVSFYLSVHVRVCVCVRMRVPISVCVCVSLCVRASVHSSLFLVRIFHRLFLKLGIH